jgi:Uma2 family endonuclease
MLNQLQRGDEPALPPCRRSGFLRSPYISNGARLGWLLLPRRRTVEVWSSDPATQAARFSALSDASRLEATAEFPGLVIELEQIWAG